MKDARLIYQLTVITAWCDGRLKDSEARELDAHGLSQEETIGLALEAKEKLDRLGLAGALSEVEIGDEIPVELYKAVAEVLIFLMRMSGRLKGPG